MEKTIEEVIIEFNTIKGILTRPKYDDLSDKDLDFMARFIMQYQDYDFSAIIEKDPNKNRLDTLSNIINKILELDYKEIFLLMAEKLEKKKSELERKCQIAKDKCHLWASKDKSILQQYQNKWKECNEKYTEAIEKWDGFDINQVNYIMVICRRLSKTLEAYPPEKYYSTFIKYDTIKSIFNLVCTEDNMKKALFKFQKEEDLFSFLNLKYGGNYLDKIPKGSNQRLYIFIDYISKNEVMDGKGVYWKERICEALHINYDENRISSYKSTYKDFSNDLENCFVVKKTNSKVGFPIRKTCGRGNRISS